MQQRSFSLLMAAGLACALMFAVSAPAQAGSVIVVTDSGGGSVDVTGTAAGADISNFNTTLTEINGSAVNLPLSFVTLHITDTAGVISGTGTKTIGDTSTTGTATIGFTITSGVVAGSHFNLDGIITSVSAPGTVGSGGTTYDFSKLFPGGLIVLAIDKTGTDFGTIVNHPGATALGSGFGLQQSQAVPEPASLALLGIGMTGFLAFRRLFRRTSVA